MHSVLILTVTFTLLTIYLESTSQPGYALSTATVSRVVRDEHQSIVAIAPKNVASSPATPKNKTIKAPLNLNLPSVENTTTIAIQAPTPNSGLFKTASEESHTSATATVSQVVRGEHQSIVAIAPKTVISPTPKDKSIKAPLDLNLPSLVNTTTIAIQPPIPTSDLFKATSKETISYNAEIIWDAKKGEDITGGKINILIPFG